MTAVMPARGQPESLSLLVGVIVGIVKETLAVIRTVLG
jgi:hypothetical protein